MQRTIKIKLNPTKKKKQEILSTMAILLNEKKSIREISRLLAIPKSTIHDYSKKVGIQNDRIEMLKLKKINIVKNNFTTNTISENEAWVLGLLYTDGNMDRNNNRVVVSQKENDKDILYKTQKIMKCGNVRKNTKHSDMYNWSYCSKNLNQSLRKYGLIPHKSFTITFPVINKRLYPHFIRGCWDGDGCFYEKETALCSQFCSSSYSFIKRIRDILNEDVGINKKIEKSISKEHYYVRYSHKNSLKLIKYLYNNSVNSNRMNRKYKQVKAILLKRYSDGVIKPPRLEMLNSKKSCESYKQPIQEQNIILATGGGSLNSAQA